LRRFDSQERGQIDEATLDQQVDLINAQAAERSPTLETSTRELSASDRTALLQSAESLLTTLRSHLCRCAPITRLQSKHIGPVLRRIRTLLFQLGLPDCGQSRT
jgi:hypothetical protein